MISRRSYFLLRRLDKRISLPKREGECAEVGNTEGKFDNGGAEGTIENGGGGGEHTAVRGDQAGNRVIRTEITGEGLVADGDVSKTLPSTHDADQSTTFPVMNRPTLCRIVHQ